MEMNTLKLQRKQIRRVFTQSCNEYENQLKDGCFEKKDQVTHLKALEDKANRLFDLDSKVSTQLLSNEDELSSDELEEVFAKEFDSCETYRERWIGYKNILDDLITNNNSSLSQSDKANSSLGLGSNQNLDHSKSLHLPKLSLKQFDGNVRNWLGFWGQFKKIHDDTNLEPEDKFQYLIQATLVDSTARELVESYPPTKDNYTKAIESLKTRFAREDMLVEVYVRDLLSLVLDKTKNGSLTLSSLHDKLTTQLNALDSLGITTQKHGAILFPLVESALPEETLRAWERHRSTHRMESKPDTNDTNLSVLLDFIKSEVESEERLSLARSGFAETSATMTTPRNIKQKNPRAQNVHSNTPTAATMLTTNNKKQEVVCLFCSKPHSTTDCAIISDWSHEKKREQLKKSGGCFTCLKRGHSSNKCKSFVKCIVCKGRHHTIMCGNIKQNENTGRPTEAAEQTENKTNVMLSQWNGQCYLQTLVVHLKTDTGTLVPVRALLDSGSQRSYVSKKYIADLSLKKVGDEIVTHTLFGGVNINNLKHNVYEIVLSSLHKNFECKVKVMDQEKICNYIPRFTDKSIIESLKRKNIVLTDSEYDLDIGLLLGADVVTKLLTTEFRSVDNGLVAVKTKLGWTIMGQSENSANRKFVTNMCATNFNSLDIPKLWKLDVLGISDPTESKAQQQIDKETLEHFNNNVKVNDDGRYSVKLPWKEGYPQLLENKDLSIKRLHSTTKKLVSMGKLEHYTNVFDEWKNLGIIEELNEQENSKIVSPQHYLPHHPVVKENSLTTKIRPVFDASAKDKNGNSLNECLVKGPNLVAEIPSLIMKFRKFDFGVSSDITKAFLQIELQEKDREYLRFLWWKSNDLKEMGTYRHCRVVFGLKSSPFLLGAVIQHLLDSAPAPLKDTANKLKTSFYVDNCITSVPTKNELECFIEESKTLMNLGKFELRSWVFTGDDKHPINEQPTPLLGLNWDSNSDTLTCDISTLRLTTTSVTKRVLLSIAQSIFDPIGFTSPSTLIPKLLLQETWKMKIGWDSQLPESIVKPFQQWISQIHFLNLCSIPRRLSHISVLLGDCSLHVFSDASKVAFSACVFLRVQLEDDVSVQLVAAKSRIAPCTNITIPRLELLGAVIATRLYKQVESSLELNCKAHFWTDSTVALTWIKRKDDWNTFVANRCREIQENSNVEDWHHISGQDNPADLPSRGCSFKSLSAEKWWEGPKWLYLNEEEWKISSYEPPEEEVFKEKKKTVVTASNMTSNTTLAKLDNISKYTKIIRTVGWVLRFVDNCRTEVQRRTNALSGEEIKNAEVQLIKMIQKEKIVNYKEKSMKKLKIFEDSQGLLRVQSRLTLGDDTNEFKYPILLPASCNPVNKMIQHHHVMNQHAGVQTLLHILREEYWLLGGRKTIKSATSSCIQCKKHGSKPIEVPFAPLPQDRIKNCKVFEVIGIDLTGPLFLKSKDKAWIVLYTCAVYRAVHLELIQSLSTDAFLQSLRRFIARRGRPLIVYTDNGTNFTGASNAFSKINWEEIQQNTSIQKICWKFNPPSAPWWGGWWERLIGCLKQLMRRTLGRSSLYYEELNTILCDCESVLNARPLTYVSSDCDDLIPLSPSSFLQSVSSNEVIDIDKVDGKNLNKRFRYLQRLRENLRSRFRKEYLGMLVNHGKQSHKDIRIGDIVLVETDNLKRISWPLAIVTEIFPGKDNITRLVQVKTANGELLRPVQRLYPLEVCSREEDEDLIPKKCFKACEESLK